MTQQPLFERTKTPSARQTQNERILALLKSGQRVTPMDALNLIGSLRLGARIWDLKKLGYEIKSQLVKRNGKRFSEYWI